MRLDEWLDKQVDIASAKFDANPTLENQVKVNQQMLADVIWMLRITDQRVAQLEARLGINSPDIGR